MVAVAYTLAGVFGREHFSAILSNFLAILGYWIAFFISGFTCSLSLALQLIILRSDLAFRTLHLPPLRP